MKKNYQQPKTIVIELGTEAHLCDVSQQGEGSGEFDTKRKNVWFDDED